MTGVYFRKETVKNSGHRNVFRGNRVLDNGNDRQGYGFYVEPYAGDLTIEDNQIGDTRGAAATQKFGIYQSAGSNAVTVRNNTEPRRGGDVKIVRASAGSRQ